MTDRLAFLTTQLLDAFDRRRTGFPLDYEEETAIYEATRAEIRARSEAAPPETEAPRCACTHEAGDSACPVHGIDCDGCDGTGTVNLNADVSLALTCYPCAKCNGTGIVVPRAPESSPGDERCACGHDRGAHGQVTGICWTEWCDCRSWRARRSP